MPARCHNDSCSISWDEVTTLSGLAYEASVNIDEARGLGDCDNGFDGLGVKLVNDTPLDTVSCRNLLRRTSAGALHAAFPDIEYVDFGSIETADRVSIAVDRTTTSPAGFAVSADPAFQFTNDTGCDAFIYLHGSFLLRYGIVGTNEASPAQDLGPPGTMIRAGHVDSDADGSGFITELTPFNAQWYVSLLSNIGSTPANTDANARAVRNFPTSGVTVTPGGTDDIQYQSVRTGFSFGTPLPAGQTIYIKHRWAHQGPEQTINVAAGGTGGTGLFDSLGGYIVGQALLIPMAGAPTL